MQEDRTDLVLFIDLAFVLLVGLLILTETAPRSNVVMPGDVDESSESMAELVVFNVHFNGEGVFRIENSMRWSCGVDRQALLEPCMRQIVRDHDGAVFVLVPSGRATVQQLVMFLDLCKLNDWTCTVSN